MKTYPSVLEMIPKETVSRHKSTKIRERTKPWHIIVIPCVPVMFAVLKRLLSSKLQYSVMFLKPEYLYSAMLSLFFSRFALKTRKFPSRNIN